MLFLDFIEWWYGAGWFLRVRMLDQHFKNLLKYFSLGVLFKTLFSPWRQNVSYGLRDQTIADKTSVILDNLVSRLVGFVARTFVIMTALLALLIITVMNLLYIAIWPLIPVSPAFIVILGATL